MLNWQELKNDLPKQVAVLCDFGLEFSSLLDLSEKHDDFFSDANMLRKLVSSFERLRQYLKTIVFTKAVILEKIKVPLVEYPLDEGDEKKMISLPVKKYMEKFESDLKVHYVEVGSLLKEEHLDVPKKTYFFFNLRSFESYVYDIVEFSKKEFYKKIKSYGYDKRSEIKDKIIKIIDWKLKQLNEVAQRILREGIQEEYYVKIVTAIILTLKSISGIKAISDITIKKINENYPSIKILLFKIENKQLKINNFENTPFIMTKIKIANNPPFSYFFSKLSNDEIEHSFNFPKPEHEEIFWNIFLASIIQRAGLFSELKEEAKKMGGKSEIIIE